jgi:biotin carboxyl carrier protein
MAHAYTPGLKVMPCTLLKKKRLLPIPGKVLAVEGQQVDALDVVAQTELPGKVFSVNVANRLAVGPGEIGAFMSKKEGDSVKKGEAIAENKPMLKWFKTTIESPIDGTVDTVSSVTGQVLLREPPKVLPIKAYVKGKVVEVISNFGVTIEAEGTFIQGIFGVGGETNGEIVMAVSSPDEDLEPEGLKETHTGKIVIGGKHASLATIKRAIELGVNALVVGGIHDRDLRQLLGYDIGVAVTGTEKLGITLSYPDTRRRDAPRDHRPWFPQERYRMQARPGARLDRARRPDTHHPRAPLRRDRHGEVAAAGTDRDRQRVPRARARGAAGRWGSGGRSPREHRSAGKVTGARRTGDRRAPRRAARVAGLRFRSRAGHVGRVVIGYYG